MFTQIITEASKDKHGDPIRIGDVITDTTSSGIGGTVVAIAGDAILFQRPDAGDGIAFDYANASDAVVVAKAASSALAPSFDANTNPIRIGDIVLTESPELSQVIHADGEALILAPIADGDEWEPLDVTKRYGYHSHQVRVLPLAVPLPLTSVADAQAIPASPTEPVAA